MTELGSQERAVLAAISANAFIGQQEIADMLGLARSTVAAHIAQLTRKGHILGRGYVLPTPGRVVCIGGAVLDRKYRAQTDFVPATSNPVDGFRSLGGVARNVAENLSLLGLETSFISIVGNDETGREILAAMRQRGIDVSQVVVTDEAPTAEYVALIGPDNELSVACADMRIFDRFTPELLERIWPHLASAGWVFADCNLSAPMLAALIERRRASRFRLAIDAVSTPKVVRLPADLTGVDVLFMNSDEAHAFLSTYDNGAAHRGASPDTAVTAAYRLRNLGAASVIVTLGAEGAAFAGSEGAGWIAPVTAQPVDITGAGDAMIAATLARMIAGDAPEVAARIGALSAALTTETTATVHPMLSPDFLDANRHRLMTEGSFHDQA
jgi:pseudouridine kinase